MTSRKRTKALHTDSEGPVARTTYDEFLTKQETGAIARTGLKITVFVQNADDDREDSPSDTDATQQPPSGIVRDDGEPVANLYLPASVSLVGGNGKKPRLIFSTTIEG